MAVWTAPAMFSVCACPHCYSLQVSKHPPSLNKAAMPPLTSPAMLPCMPPHPFLSCPEPGRSVGSSATLRSLFQCGSEMLSNLANATQPEEGQTPTLGHLNDHEDRCGGESEVGGVCALGCGGLISSPGRPQERPARSR